ncbi:MAG: hypothetical protein NWR97_00205 [Salibacteraceae bacterium]|nr:hypothetical protein [Salibacteraceae bacterium]
MSYLEFKSMFSRIPMFSIQDIEKIFPGFDNRRLVEWQKKGYIAKIRRGYYYLTDQPINEAFLFKAANKIYSPSYVSLESAFSFYNLIPEATFVIRAVSTQNTAHFDTPLSQFDYKHVKPSLFFGYVIETENNYTFKIAELEKALLDFIYFKKIDDLDKLDGLRLNIQMLEEGINWNKLEAYQLRFQSKTLDKRMRMLKSHIYA